MSKTNQPDNFHYKLQKATLLLQQRKIDKKNYQPLIYPLLWRLGIQIPPPHFSKLWVNLTLNGIPGGLMGIGFYMMAVDYEHSSYFGMLAAVCVCAGAWGGSIAAYYELGKKTHRIPDWNSLT